MCVDLNMSKKAYKKIAADLKPITPGTPGNVTTNRNQVDLADQLTG